MSTGDVRPARRKRKRARADVGEGASPEAQARVDELRRRWGKLKEWGVAEKLKWTKETQSEIEKFFAAWDKDPDPTQVSPTTADVRRLELEAADYDKQRAAAKPYQAQTIQTAYSLDQGSTVLKTTTTIDEGAREAGAIAKDIAKETSALIDATAEAMPWWVWAGLGVGVLYLGWLGKRAVDKAAGAAGLAAMAAA